MKVQCKERCLSRWVPCLPIIETKSSWSRTMKSLLVSIHNSFVIFVKMKHPVWWWNHYPWYVFALPKTLAAIFWTKHPSVSICKDFSTKHCGNLKFFFYFEARKFTYFLSLLWIEYVLLTILICCCQTLS